MSDSFDYLTGYKHQFSTLVDLLRYRSLHQPDQIAYTFLLDGEASSISINYKELDQKARAIAALLQKQGVKGERALLLYPPGLDFIAAFFGCLFARVVAVPAYPPRSNQKLSRLQVIALDSQGTLALTTTSLLSNIEGRFAQDTTGEAMRWLATDNLTDDLANEWIPTDCTENTLAFLQYTSGSTGTPKGVMITHGNLLYNSALINHCFQDTPESLGVSWLPPYHDMGLIGGIIQPLYVGAPMILMSPVDFLQKPLRWLQAISHYQATTSGGPNFAYEFCASKITEQQLAALDLSSWELAFTGAEPVRAETLEKFAATFAPCGFRREAFYPCYGMAETTLIVSGGLKTAPPIICQVDGAALEQNQVVPAQESSEGTRTLVGCGRTWLKEKIAIVEPESLRKCAPSQVGEIWVSGESVAQGYWHQPEKTQQTFHGYLADTGEGPFLRTGDLGFVQDGELFVTGRLKDLIIIRGRNHYPQDLELTVERSHPALRLGYGAAFAVEVAGEERLVIVQEVERRYLRNLEVDEVTRAIRTEIAQEHSLQPFAVVLLKTNSIPKTSSGKIQRHACQAGFLEGSLEVVGEWRENSGNQKPKTNNQQPKTNNQQQGISPTSQAIQAWLITKIAERLGIEPQEIDIREPFASYGLDSVAAVRLSGELEEWLGRRLAPTLVYDYPTIEALARYLSPEEIAPLTHSLSRRHKGEQNPKTSDDLIAIIGIGCRLPGANNPQAFWQLLRNGVDGITEVPAHRWHTELQKPIPQWGGFLEQVDQFDPQFFGIAPREAQSMDPQQRLLLEVSWEALENAGIAADKLAGSQTGVFIGISNYDYSRLQSHDDPYSGTGNALSIAANRLSYLLDLRGPSWSVDTACSSSLVAVHQATQSLQQGECHLALAGGVNLILSPELTLTFAQAGMLAADGRCKTFSAHADGYVRGEGCGIVVLKRLSNALRDGDNVLALIKGTAVNQDGRSNGLTAPNGPAQQAVILQALENAGVEPAQISYFEAHGTGTSLGDPIEVNSLKEVLMEGRSLEQLCWLGSVKTNIGHLEAAAGIAGLIKVVLSLQNGQIPPHLHFQQLNPHIDIEDTPLVIPTQLQAWQTSQEPRLAGVSSFGFGGTNAHIILEEATAPAPEVAEVERPKHLLTLSAKTELALAELAQAYAAYLQNPMASLADICFTANIGRSHFEYRLAVITESTTQLLRALTNFATGNKANGLQTAEVPSSQAPKLAFLFTGQGSQYVGMGRELYQTQPTFRQSLDRCAEILHPYLEKPLLEIIYPQTEDNYPDSPILLDETAYTQPALFALEYALAQLWQSWGVEPTLVMGHSVGEYVAACIAGVFSLEDGLKLIAERARLMQALPKTGEMVVVFASLAVTRAAIQPYTNACDIAAINSPENTVISGEEQAIAAVITTLTAKGIKTQKLQVSHAFHSPLMEPMLEEFEQVASEVTYSSPQINLVSNITGELATKEIATPEYWCRHVRESVQFAASIETLLSQGYEVFVEIGPKPILLGMARNCLPNIKKGNLAFLPSLRQSKSDWQQLLQSLTTLYLRGIPVDLSGFDQNYPRHRVVLPTYPFQRQRYWVEMRRHGDTETRDAPDTEIKESFPNSTQQISDWLYEVEWQLQPRQNTHLPPDYIPSPQAISNLLKPQLTQLITQPDLEAYGEALLQLEALSITYVVKALLEMGWEFQLNQPISTAQIAQQLGVVSQHQRLLKRLLEMLAEEGILLQVSEGWQSIAKPKLPEPQEQSSTLLANYPAAEAELNLLQRCGSELAQVLTGKSDPLQLLFPQGDLTPATKLYQESPGARVMNTLVQKAVTTALDKLPAGRIVRILEIGAGTGGTTSYILPHLRAQQTKYTFTDLSPLFTIQAQEKFRDYPFVEYQQLNIEQNPELQEFELHQYDVIVAANVLHATKDLRQTLQHVQSLLAPEGMLVLLEGTARLRLMDLIFGLTEGWWQFTDHDLRPSYPLIAAHQWQEILQETGFEQAVTITPEQQNSAGVLAQQAVIVAQREKASFENIPQPKTTGSWLILADAQGIGQQLATTLRSKGETCHLAFPGKKYQQIAPEEISLNPTNPADFEQLLETIVTTQNPLRGVVHLWSLDAVETQYLTKTTLDAVIQQKCGSTLHLVQALVKTTPAQPPALWLVTRGAQPVGQKAKVVEVTSSPLWGMGKVIALEHPELNCVRVDLDPEATGNQAQDLFEEIWSQQLEKGSTLEDQVAFRDGLRQVARLVHHHQNQETPVQNNPSFRGDSTYLLTGGLGGLGLLVSQWMVEQGARHLVLVGRSSPKEEVQEQLKKLEKAGAEVVVTQADVSEAEQIARVLAEIEQTLPPLRGIIHAAGVLDDGILLQQTWERFNRVMAPKIQGAWHLHNLTQNQTLDFFLLFSSAAALLGSPGQANHGAANAFLDAFAHYRRSQGLPASSINWGIWSDIGAAAKRQAGERMKMKGLDMIAPQQGLQILAQLLTENAVQVGVVPVRWSDFLAALPVGMEPPYLTEVVREVQSPTTKQDTAHQDSEQQETVIFEQLLEMSASQREEFLLSYLQRQISQVLQLERSQLSLSSNLLDLGMDSLMVMEAINRLKRDLQLMLYPREFYERPRIDTLAKYIATEFQRVHNLPVTEEEELERHGDTETRRRGDNSQFPIPNSQFPILNKLPGIIFILSGPRSGSTLLRVMLAGHPDLFSPPELHLLPFNTMQERQQELALSYLGEGLQRAFMEIMGIDAAASQALVEELESQNLSIQQVYGKLQELAGKRLLVDKSPTYAMSRETLARAEQIFAGAKYIHLVRHPYAMIESFVRLRMDKLVGKGDTNPYQLAEEVWTQSNQNILDFCQQLEPERHYQVHYEELVKNPAQVMGGLSEFLGIPFKPELLNPYEGKRMTDGVHATSAAINDPNFLQHKSIDPSLGEAWKKIKLPHQLGESALRLATQLEYELPRDQREIRRHGDAETRRHGDEEIKESFQIPKQQPTTNNNSPTMGEFYLDVRGHRLCLCTWGPEAGPLVLCLHGILEQGAAWEEVAVPLAKMGYRVVAPDLRGHGRSSHIGKGNSANLVDFLGDVDAIVAELTDQPFILVGHSIGSVVAAMYASVRSAASSASRSQKVRTLVLVDTVLPSDGNDNEVVDQLATHLDYLVSPPEHPVFPDVATAASRLRRGTATMSEALALKLANRITEPCDGGVRWSWDPMLRTRTGIGFNGNSFPRARYLELLRRIQAPTILIYGDSSHLNRTDDLSEQQAAMPQAKRVFLSGGHNLHIDAPQAIANLIAEAAMKYEV